MTTIDPEKFEPQGKPSRQQARAVWDSLPRPSARKVATVLTQRGFEISWRTIARWHSRDWREDMVAPRPELQANKVLTAALRRVTPITLEEANLIARSGGLEGAINGGALTLDDQARIAMRRDELLRMSGPELSEVEAKARRVMNVLLMEEAARRANVMVLIPKDTSSIIEAFTDAAKQTLVPADTKGGDGARVIEGKAEPVNPIASAIDKYLADVA